MISDIRGSSLTRSALIVSDWRLEELNTILKYTERSISGLERLRGTEGDINPPAVQGQTRSALEMTGSVATPSVTNTLSVTTTLATLSLVSGEERPG